MPRSLFLVLVTLLSVVTPLVLSGPRWPAVQAQPVDDPGRLRELAERLLVQPYGAPYPFAGTQDTPPPTAELLVNQLPASLPWEVPLPAGAQVLGSVVRSGGSPGPGGPRVEIVADVPGSTAQIQEALAQDFTDRGWHSPAFSPYGPSGPGGFQPTGGPTLTRTYCPPDDQGYLNLTVRPLREGVQDLRLSWFAPPSEPSGPFPTPVYYGPCSTPEAPGPPGRPVFPSENPIPALTPPSGVRLQPTGGSGGPGSFGSDALAETGLSASALEAHFSEQLQGAGWALTERGEGSTLAWSTWRITVEEQERTGLLLITELPEQRRSLTVRVFSDGSEFRPGGIRG
jgi:hypothetical protein